MTGKLLLAVAAVTVPAATAGVLAYRRGFRNGGDWVAKGLDEQLMGHRFDEWPVQVHIIHDDHVPGYRRWARNDREQSAPGGGETTP